MDLDAITPRTNSDVLGDSSYVWDIYPKLINLTSATTGGVFFSEDAFDGTGSCVGTGAASYGYLI